MSGGYLGLAYLAEISVVFNLAYSELRDRRYVENGEAIIGILRKKVGQAQFISRKDSELYMQLDGLNHSEAAKRHAAWSYCDNDCGIYNGVLAKRVYPFFQSRKDKNIAWWCCGISVIVIFLATLFDHFFLFSCGPIAPYIWCIFLTILFFCLLYPVLIIFVGRGMMKRLDKVATHLLTAFKNVVEPTVMDSINADIRIIEAREFKFEVQRLT